MNSVSKNEGNHHYIYLTGICYGFALNRVYNAAWIDDVKIIFEVSREKMNLMASHRRDPQAAHCLDYDDRKFQLKHLFIKYQIETFWQAGIKRNDIGEEIRCSSFNNFEGIDLQSVGPRSLFPHFQAERALKGPKKGMSTRLVLLSVKYRILLQPV